MNDSSRMKRHLRASIAVTAIFSACTIWAAEPGLTVVEFYNTNLKHYFITADPVEQTGIDQGRAGAGWVRTGVSFAAWANGQSSTAKPVCRFYGPGPNSHFYTADAGECDFVKRPGSGWNYEGLVFNIEVPGANGCAAGTQGIYRAYNNGFVRNDSNHRYTPDLSQLGNTAGYASEGVTLCSPLSTTEKRRDAARLLKQATFGPTAADIDLVVANGTTNWVNDQLTRAASQYSPRAYMPITRPTTCVDDTATPVRADSYCARDNYSLYLPQIEFYKQALQSPDQLRQRVAWAWSQFFVTSGVDINQAYGMIDYQQMLRDNAFGNFETLLSKVTLHPVMGDYLDMANNRKSQANGVQPNENYARELLQLFSIGTVMLNDDGTPQRRTDGTTIPSYEQTDIMSFARVFTGWTYPTVPGQTSSATTLNGRNYVGVMEERATFHDTAQKTLLLGGVSAANVSMSQDLTNALRNVFNHTNVPPFVSKYLIQKLVTGNPSPAYVKRIAGVFKNNGSGVRGDVAAVVKAILLDPEARGPAKFDSSFGHLNEPVLHITNVARALGVTTDGVYFRGLSDSSGQRVFYSPTVFNYYSPDYVVASNKLNSPEFDIFDSSTTINRLNLLQGMLYATTALNASTAYYGATGTQFNWTPFTSVAASSDALLDKVNELVFAGSMSTAVRAAIKPAIDAVAATDTLGRARAALYLAAAAPQSQVTR